MVTFKATPIVVSIHRSDEHPVFGEGALHLSMKDEGGGVFFNITNDGDGITAEMEELELILDLAKKMAKGEI